MIIVLGFIAGVGLSLAHEGVHFIQVYSSDVVENPRLIIFPQNATPEISASFPFMGVYPEWKENITEEDRQEWLNASGTREMQAYGIEFLLIIPVLYVIKKVIE